MGAPTVLFGIAKTPKENTMAQVILNLEFNKFYG